MHRVAVVTGASSGIGAATAVRLAGAGYHVVAAARRMERIESLAARIRADGGQAEARQLDVTDRAGVDALADSLDRCDVLVANAGGAIGADQIADGRAEDWRAMYEVNVLGTLNVTQALLPGLIASGDGTVVMMSSTAGFVGYEGGGRLTEPTMPREQGPSVVPGLTGTVPNLPHGPESFQDRASRCAFQSGLYGVPGGARTQYMGSCVQ